MITTLDEKTSERLLFQVWERVRGYYRYPLSIRLATVNSRETVLALCIAAAKDNTIKMYRKSLYFPTEIYHEALNDTAKNRMGEAIDFIAIQIIKTADHFKL